MNSQASVLMALFAAKGYSGEDLAALLGAHSTSTQFGVDPTQRNASQDSTYVLGLGFVSFNAGAR